MKALLQMLVAITIAAPAAQAASVDVSHFSKLVSKTRFLRITSEAKVLEAYVHAWNNNSGNNVEDILAHIIDGQKISFRDPLTRGTIEDKATLRKYLERLYIRFPKQKWGIESRVYPSLNTPGEWAVYNKFELYDNVNDEKPSFTGTGMDLFRFANDGSGKLVVDEVHLIVDGLDISTLLKFR